MTAYRPCVLCAGRTRETEFTLPMGTVVRCHGCSLVSMVGRTGELVRCSYDERYYRRADAPGPGYSDYFGAQEAVRREISCALADTVLSLAPAAQHVLDLGCGGGFLVDAMVERGVGATGLDGSEHAIEQARAHGGGGRYLRAGIGAADLPAAAPFDVVTLIDVIEHLPDPVEALRWAAGLTAPEGKIVLLTPRYGGRLLSEQGAAYVHFNSDHMYYFTESTLRAIITRAIGPALTRIEDVLTLVRKQNVAIPDSMARKYGVDRESMLATVTL
ncbi:class I SAM-dependent methyltransferase [Actinomadura madurae]|uniref:Methyltransferase domain-containing protein n=1 Tax=Actinomadura madurae TaxID=1993 RepID=A0A1I5C6V6_9ACTN|nr:class I SAM-dependent methyltransferase [Actinomadura madurae]SFN82719.1 Methyltransferase domain-containing protein [Actinomadura madurae]SPT50798.1 3-demethylubiquinone-9 3-methyltransferase [Actinomadura madurae]